MANWECVSDELNGGYRCISRTIFNMKVLDKEWKTFILSQTKKIYLKDNFKELKKNIIECYQNKINIYRNPKNILKVLELVPLNKIKVVIIGQDPYFKSVLTGGENIPQAHGLSFSVPDNITIPPSLKTIFNELKREYEEFEIPTSGNLTKWTNEGVFLLNASLTVIDGKPNSHNKYWYEFTDEMIKYINKQKKNIVFMLWGNFAKAKAKLIDDKNEIIISGHPSPLNTTNPFIGCNCFIDCNKYLEKNGITPINWKL